MNQKIKDHLSQYLIKNKWEVNEDNMIESLMEAKNVFTEIGAAHRWYDEKFVVVNIDGMLIGYDYYHVTGDTSISDMGLDFDINSVCEVEEKQKTITIYEKVK